MISFIAFSSGKVIYKAERFIWKVAYIRFISFIESIFWISSIIDTALFCRYFVLTISE